MIWPLDSSIKTNSPSWLPIKIVNPCDFIVRIMETTLFFYSTYWLFKFGLFVQKTSLDHDTLETTTNIYKNDLKWNSRTNVTRIPI